MRLLLACFALLAALPATVTAAPVLGVYSEEDPFWVGPAIVKTGFGSVRRPFNWSQLQPERDRFDFAGYDRIVLDAAQHGLTMLPFLVDAPPWAVSRPAGETGMRPPRDLGDFARFAQAMVWRYGPGGTLWKEYYGVPYRPIRAWQVWNEPNLPAFWRPEPNAAAYVKLLRAGAKAIHAVDRGATVVSAGLPESQGGIPQSEFLRQEYDAGLKAAADAVAVHAYAPDALGVLALVAGARREMKRRGDPAPLWVTEFGWATGGEPSLFTTDEAGQAQRLGDALYGLRRLASSLDLGGIFVFRFQDPAERTLDVDIWPYHSGLVRRDGTAKPSFAGVRAAIARPLPEGDYDLPLARLKLHVKRAGRKAARIRCSRACAASLVLVQRISRPGRAPLQKLRAQRTLLLRANHGRRVRLSRLAGRTLTVSAVTSDGAAKRVSRSFHRRGHR